MYEIRMCMYEIRTYMYEDQKMNVSIIRNFRERTTLSRYRKIIDKTYPT